MSYNNQILYSKLKILGTYILIYNLQAIKNITNIKQKSSNFLNQYIGLYYQRKSILVESKS